MRIIHYIFGLPPVRTGGLIKYALDLAFQQQSMGHDVTILCPGSFQGKDVKKTEYVQENYKGHKVVRIKNPLPVPMTNGILDIERYTTPGRGDVYCRLIQELQPDILHIHSFMGLHAELLKEAKKQGVYIVYTTNDYFGLCPAVTLFKEGHNCDEEDWSKCFGCCQNAFSEKKLRRQQSKAFYYYKKSKVVELLKNIPALMSFVEHKKKKNANKACEKNMPIPNYEDLRQYYEKMFREVDCFHFNSTIARAVYEKRISVKDGMVIGISHKDMKDQRKQKQYFGDRVLRISYLGQPRDYKGYWELLNALDRLFETRKNFCLNVYFEKGMDTREYIHHHSPYAYHQLPQIMEETDFVVVPSIWMETYGFVVPEAVSFGVPVLVTDCVGASDLVRTYDAGWVVSSGWESLYHKMLEIYDDRGLLRKANISICNAEINFNFSEHVKEIIALYQRR